MKIFSQAGIALLTVTPLLLGALSANAEPMPAVSRHGAAALQPAVAPSSTTVADSTLGPKSPLDQLIRDRQDFLLVRNCFNTEHLNPDSGVILTCRARALPALKFGVGPQPNDAIADREGFQLDLIRSRHNLEGGPFDAIGGRIRF